MTTRANQHFKRDDTHAIADALWEAPCVAVD
jgi:hypothetical protein